MAKNESELTQGALKLLRSNPNLWVWKHWDRGVGCPDASVTGYGRTTWLEMKAPPVGRNLLAYVAASMAQLHNMCRADKPAGFAHYLCWTDQRHLQIWRPRMLMYFIRDVGLDTATYKSVFWNEPVSRKRIINRLYSPETNGPLQFDGDGYEVIYRLLTEVD